MDRSTVRSASFLECWTPMQLGGLPVSLPWIRPSWRTEQFFEASKEHPRTIFENSTKSSLFLMTNLMPCKHIVMTWVDIALIPSPSQWAYHTVDAPDLHFVDGGTQGLGPKTKETPSISSKDYRLIYNVTPRRGRKGHQLGGSFL